MKPLRLSFLTALLATVCGATAHAQSTPATADARYVTRVGDRYIGFAGSSANLESLAAGLRRGSSVTLTEGSTRVEFVPPTRPMGYGNITRALDLASRQLSAAGITSPTPDDVRAALIGGTNGNVTLQGVLRLRSQGMGWGQIAHALGLHAGLRASATATAHSSVGLTRGASSASIGDRRPGIVTGMGGAFSAGSAQRSASGQGPGNAFGRAGRP